jgi:hypothetical protein
MKTRVRMVFLSFAVLLVATALSAQEAWLKKDFTQWNSEDVKKILTSSPWAKDVTIGTSAPNTHGGEAGGNPRGIEGEGGGGGIENPGGGGGGGRGGGRGGAGGGGGASGPVKLIISWRTALPVKQALVKSKLGAATEVPAAAKGFLEKTEEQYVIMIEGLPNRFAQAAQQDKVGLGESVLKVGKKEIHIANSSFNRHGDTTEIALLFPKTDAIKIEDGEVEVDAKLGLLEAKKKFKLKDMVVNGKLEL